MFKVILDTSCLLLYVIQLNVIQILSTTNEHAFKHIPITQTHAQWPYIPVCFNADGYKSHLSNAL